jgi:carbonic anhydrase/acetyltransferase-like protein (isoleucine patch superfamily)
MNFTSIGDNSVIHTAPALPTGMNAKVYIGYNVTVGAGCTLYSCHIEDDCVIGDKSIILEGARIEKAAMILPGSVVPPGRLIPAKQLWGGNPVEYIKDLDIGEQFANYSYSYITVALGDAHKYEFTAWPSNYLLQGAHNEDVETKEQDIEGAYTTKNLHKGLIKYYS